MKAFLQQKKGRVEVVRFFAALQACLKYQFESNDLLSPIFMADRFWYISCATQFVFSIVGSGLKNDHDPNSKLAIEVQIQNRLWKSKFQTDFGSPNSKQTFEVQIQNRLLKSKLKTDF